MKPFFPNSRGPQFRTEFSKISEIRALTPPSTNVMALTATANSNTQKKIIESLEMFEHEVIIKVPNKKNIFYTVLPRPSSSADVLDPIIEELCTHKTKTDRTLVFCHSYADVINLYQTAALQLNEKGSFYVTPSPSMKKSECRLCDKYDACTALDVRKNIISSFTNPEGVLRLVFATTAFGMGIDSPNIRRVIHWSPPNDIEMYVQESGRGGRDNERAVAIMYYSEHDLRNVSEDMKLYCQNVTKCRRSILMESFGIENAEDLQLQQNHQCCDICARVCTCLECTAALLQLSPWKFSSKGREVNAYTHTTDHDVPVELPTAVKLKIKKNTEWYRYKVCERIERPAVSLLIGLELATGLSNELIENVVSHCTPQTSVCDLLKLNVPSEHVNPILCIIKYHTSAL